MTTIDDATLQRAQQTAPLGYLEKPCKARELRIAVEIALRHVGLEAGELKVKPAFPR